MRTQPNIIDQMLALAQENWRLSRIEYYLIKKMAHIQQGLLEREEIAGMMRRNRKTVFLEQVGPNLNSHSRICRTRALIITFHLLGVRQSTISEFVLYSPRAIRKFIHWFDNEQYEKLFRRSNRIKKSERKDLKDQLFEVMHAPPQNYDINRTTWTIPLLHDVLAEKGCLIGKNTIGKMICSEGYNFRKTREVLTSNDPDYKTKLEKITRTLRRLGPADRFFSIDEFGPVSIRERGGRRRVRRNEKPTIPQYQDSKGHIIVTAALELSSNQITHFYSKKKDTEEMIKLLHLLIEEYWDCRRLYFSWDAASWHSSKKFCAEVKRVNSRKYRLSNQSPMIKLIPLPARAQFLNVIESVFSGLAQSIIHNSNYPSVDAAKKAIDRYFQERNEHFRNHPRRAGNKIWGKEQVPSHFSVSHNCKDPKFMRIGLNR